MDKGVDADVGEDAGAVAADGARGDRGDAEGKGAARGAEGFGIYPGSGHTKGDDYHKYGAVVGWDGTRFRGWQLQGADPRFPERGAPRTVQGAIERAWSEALDPSRDPVERAVTAVSAGRTDVGVHAVAMPLHVWTPTRVDDLEAATRALAGTLPRDVWVVRLERVPREFVANVGVERKTYRFQLWDGAEGPPERHLGRCWWVADRRPKPPRGTPFVRGVDMRGPVPVVDVDAMRECAARTLVQTREFSGLAAPNRGVSKVRRKLRREARERGEEPGPKHDPHKESVRTIFRCDVERTEEHLVSIEVEGSGFLYKMVRLIASLLFDVGTGRRSLEDAERLIARADSHATALELRPAPSEGLCLREVCYAEDHPGASSMNPQPLTDDASLIN